MIFNSKSYSAKEHQIVADKVAHNSTLDTLRRFRCSRKHSAHLTVADQT